MNSVSNPRKEKEPGAETIKRIMQLFVIVCCLLFVVCCCLLLFVVCYCLLFVVC